MLLVALLGEELTPRHLVERVMDGSVPSSQRLFCCLATRKLASYHFSVGVERNKVKADSTLKHTSGLVMKENSLKGGGSRAAESEAKGFDGLCSAAASLTVISVKAVSGMITESIKGQLQLIYPIFYIMLVVMIASCAFQIKSVNVFFGLFCVDCLLFFVLQLPLCLLVAQLSLSLAAKPECFLPSLVLWMN